MTGACRRVVCDCPHMAVSIHARRTRSQWPTVTIYPQTADMPNKLAAAEVVEAAVR